MSLSLAVQRREHEWYADVREVPGTGSLGSTREAAIAGALRKLAEKAERLELTLDMFIAEAPPASARPFTGADFLALVKRLPHPGPEWADAVEEVTRAQPTVADEPAPWAR